LPLILLCHFAISPFIAIAIILQRYADADAPMMLIDTPYYYAMTPCCHAATLLPHYDASALPPLRFHAID